jgi:hypothetical protein
MRCSRLRITIATASLLLAVCAFAQENVRDIYERARLLDDNNQNVREAIKLYAQVVAQAGDQRALAARAQYRIGVLYERLGRKDDARRAFQAVVDQYPDQTDLARRARAKTAEPERNEPPPLVRQTGPSADGFYFETLTFSEPGNLLPAVDPVRRRLYVVTSNYTPTYEPSSLIVVDADSSSVIRTVPLGVYIDEMAFDAANNRMYATAQVNGHVRVIDTTTFAQTEIPITGRPTGIAVNPVTSRVYVSSQGYGGNDKLFVIDANTSVVTGSYDLDGVAGKVFVNSATNRVYAIASPKTRVFDGADPAFVTDLIGIGVVHVDSARNRIYAHWPEKDLDTLQIIDGTSHAATASLVLAYSIPSLAFDHDVSRLYVALAGKDQIAVVDLARDSEAARFLLPGTPRKMLVDPATGQVYVCHGSGTDTPMIGVFHGRKLDTDIPREFSDGFESATLHPSWTVLSASASYSLTAQRDHLRVRAATRDRSKPRALVMRRFIGDHWILDLKTSYFTGRSGGGRNLFFGVHFGLATPKGVVQETEDPKRSSYLQISRTRSDWNGCCAGEVMMHVWERGKTVATNALPVMTVDTYVWRIRRDGRTVTVERSVDGNVFTAASTYTFGSQIDGVVESFVIGIDAFAETDAYVDYDYVRLRKSRK